MPRSENYSTDSVQSFKSNFREHLAFWLSSRCVLEHVTASKAMQNILRVGECDVNRPLLRLNDRTTFACYLYLLKNNQKVT